MPLDLCPLEAVQSYMYQKVTYGDILETISRIQTILQPKWSYNQTINQLEEEKRAKKVAQQKEKI